MPGISLEAVSFRYPKAKALALSDVTLEIPEGSFFALLGPNGAGKTTLLRILCGRLLPTSGKVVCEGGAADFGVLLENPGAYDRLSVFEYLEFFGALYGVKQARARAADLLGAFDFSEGGEARVGTLSLGNRQKLQMARALLHRPRTLLLDEPASNMDPVSRAELWRALLAWMKQEGGTLLVCSHILSELETLATHFAVLKRGEVFRTGKVPQTAGEAFLGVPLAEALRARQVLGAAGIEARPCSGAGDSFLKAVYDEAFGS